MNRKRTLLLSLTALWVVLFVATDRVAKHHQGVINILHSNLSEAQFISIITGLCLSIGLYIAGREGKAKTVCIGPLTTHLDNILQLIRNAKPHSLLKIMLDCPDYGSLENYEQHLAILREIRNALINKHVDVRFLLLGEPATVSRANCFVSTRGDYEAFRRSKRYQQFMQQFRGEKEPQSWEEFFAFTKSYMEQVLKALKRWGADIRRLPDADANKVVLFLFATDREAVYIRLDGNPPEATHTTDSGRVRELNADFDHYWNMVDSPEELLAS